MYLFVLKSPFRGQVGTLSISTILQYFFNDTKVRFRLLNSKKLIKIFLIKQFVLIDRIFL